MKILFLSYIYVLPRSRQVQMTREIAISNALSTPTPRILISAPVITEKDNEKKKNKKWRIRNSLHPIMLY